MSKKQDIRSEIDTQLASGNQIPISTARGVLKNNSVNIVDNMYPDYRSDNEQTQSYFQQTQPFYWDFTFTLCKQGRLVFVNGIIDNVVAVQTADSLGAFIVDEFNIDADITAVVASQSLMIYADGSRKMTNLSATYNTSGQTILEMKPVPQVGASLYFSLIYMTEN